MSKEPIKYYVYTLTDPFNMEIKYVGITKNCKARINHHFFSRNNSEEPIKRWVRVLNLKGTWPLFNIVAEYDNAETAKSMEACLIKKMGKDLLNVYFNPCVHVKRNRKRHE